MQRFFPLDLSRPTYVVLDVPSPLSRHLGDLRWRFAPECATLPAEITIIGFSGVGVLDAGQSESEIFECLEAVAVRTQPLAVRFGSLTTFPGSGVYSFPPTDPQPFVVLQRELIDGGLRCGPSPFSFTPHLTVARFKPEDGALEAGRILPPEGEFRLDQLAIYSQVSFDTQLHARVALTGSVA